MTRPLLLGFLWVAARSMSAQSLTDRPSASVGVAMSTWSFGKSVPLDSSAVKSVQQLAVPYTFRLPLGKSWNVDVAGAVSRASVTLDGGKGTRELSALSDARVRLVGPLLSDRVLATLSLNLPIGATSLNSDELDVLRVVASPALQLPVAAFGTGFGGGVGLAYAWQVSRWSVAAGASYELRGSYQPVEGQIFGAATTADLRPGGTLRASLAFDRLVGESRVSLLASAVVFGEDRFDVHVGGANSSSSYTLGPVVSISGQVDLATTRLRDARLYFADRLRMKYLGQQGERVPGSNGNILEIGAAGSLGRIGRPAPFGSVAAYFDSGLASDPNITTTAATMLKVQLGYELPTRRSLFRPFVGINVGRIDPGSAATSALGLQAGLSMRSR